MQQNLLEQLNSCGGQYYPLHMPGHKRRLDPTGGALPVGIDITEITGMDDLHHATGILKDAEARTAALYGAGATRYLVNGSTVGILAAIRSVAARNGEIIAARNCHKSVFHAIELMNLTAHYLMPETIPSYDIFGGIRPEAVRAAVHSYPRAAAVILTSPTYEGIVSDIAAIAGICHDAGIPLIVDEAHGAHLIERFRGNMRGTEESAKTGDGQEDGPFWPSGAVAGGADLVIQSAHKTLPSLTQTAWIHINGDLVDPGRVDHELDVFETSSPSYPMMASLDACTGLLIKKGQELFTGWERNLRQFDGKTADLKRLTVLSRSGYPGNICCDPGKILVSGRNGGLTGAALAAILRSRYGFETEMAVGYNVLAMTSPADDPDELRRFADALLAIDRAAEGEETVGSGETGQEPPDSAANGPVGERQEMPESETVRPEENKNSLGAAWMPAAEPKRTIAEAMEAACERIPLARAVSRIAAEYVWAYPPGVPLIVPGEKITKSLPDTILQLKAMGTEVYHMGRARGDAGDGTILAVKEQCEGQADNI